MGFYSVSNYFMQISINNKHLHLSDDQKDYIGKKINHLKHLGERVNDESTQVRVDVETNNLKNSDRNISLQITMFLPQALIRAESRAVSAEEAIDLAVEKMEKQLERYKNKSHRRDQSGKWIPSSTLEQITSTQEGMAEVGKVSKRKVFDEMSPMHEEEAIEQMELLGHDFYAFFNSDTSNFNVVYRREDGSYGLLEMNK